MEVMLRHNENLKVVEEEHEQLKIAFAEQSQRSVSMYCAVLKDCVKLKAPDYSI